MSLSPSASISPSASASPTQAAPTANYDVYIKDQSGHDLLEGVGVDRDNATTQHAVIVYAGTSLHPVVDETDVLTLQISNNVVASAQIEIVLYYALGA